MKKIVVKQEQSPLELFSTMGCRTANGADCNFEESYIKNIRSVIETGVMYDDMFSAAQKPGRGNICPTTIILPTLAMQVKVKSDKNGLDVVDEFMKLLEKKIGEAKDSLLDRFDWISSQPACSAKFMYENGTMYGYKPEEGIKSALKHGTLAIGQLGLAETLQILIGEDHGTKVDEPSNDTIVSLMVSKIENKENRKLSSSEINEIENFVKSKKSDNNV